MANLRFQVNLDNAQILESWLCLSTVLFSQSDTGFSLTITLSSQCKEWLMLEKMCWLSVRNNEDYSWAFMISFICGSQKLHTELHCPCHRYLLSTTEKVKKAWRISSLSQTVHIPFIVSQDPENGRFLFLISMCHNVTIQLHSPRNSFKPTSATWHMASLSKKN